MKNNPRFRADNPGMSFLLADSLNMWFSQAYRKVRECLMGPPGTMGEGVDRSIDSGKSIR